MNISLAVFPLRIFNKPNHPLKEAFSNSKITNPLSKFIIFD